jgi:hypothetical protein
MSRSKVVAAALLGALPLLAPVSARVDSETRLPKIVISDACGRSWLDGCTPSLGDFCSGKEMFQILEGARCTDPLWGCS